ncbi:MAG: RecX family transcriptional regulator [Clostridiaceae bacterium]|nr:RecX family transcriptional regulator [Clostridiaceae bacterium]
MANKANKKRLKNVNKMKQEESFQKRLTKAQEIVSQLHQDFLKKRKTNQASDVPTKHQEAYFALRQRAIKYIGIDRGRSSGQVKKILENSLPEEAALNPQLIERVVQDLIDEQYLDEYLCGRRTIKRHSGRAQKSKKYIEQLMLRQGLSEQTVSDLILEIEDDQVTAETYRIIKQEEWEISQPEKVMRHLASRGYSTGICQEIVRKWLNEISNDE